MMNCMLYGRMLIFAIRAASRQAYAFLGLLLAEPNAFFRLNSLWRAMLTAVEDSVSENADF